MAGHITVLENVPDDDPYWTIRGLTDPKVRKARENAIEAQQVYNNRKTYPSLSSHSADVLPAP